MIVNNYQRMVKFITIATLNLCLGLKSKKELIKDLLNTNDIYILAMQETEIEHDFDCKLLTIPGYNLEIEDSESKKRTGFYIWKIICYDRCYNLEQKANHLIIIDIYCESGRKRLVNIYRTFSPPRLTVMEFFVHQCDLVRASMIKDTLVLGDFNI